MLKSTILSFTCYLLIGSNTFAQCTGLGSNLVAPYASNALDNGVMFDISATNTITIYCFDVNLPPLSIGDYEVYYKAGTYVGSENSPGNWTFIGSAGSIVSIGLDLATPLTIPVNVVIPLGETYGFYITASNPILSTGVFTTTNAGYSTVSSNGDIAIMGGIGIAYPFNTISANRSLNGTIRYTPGNALPVEFIDFSVIKNGESAILEWETESEYNSDYFEIERSKNGIDWNRLLLIQATGEINSPTIYQETDLAPLEGISYYRLNQYDIDGTKTFLKSVSFNYELEVERNEIRVFPNPIADRVRVFGDQSEIENLIVFNSIGQDISDNLTIIKHNGYSEIYFRDQQEGLFILKSKTNSEILIKK
ncbi:hypothetical protein [Fluviicola taffensis]|uniref:Secretion system C-terminal sorting domain-containing protein n=1 Tax=Fluviicola taffensis (strain DSM 16823 / NCIMB 13979 / RW262) TaxID=755732 RepID=F2IDT0_FLUTR|nr:hypothetical protein [Fluviicola taffensis]AEA44472.1 hypothetical protein Fluta_2487 [Fluviicola taffensis DSM 16823]